MPLPSTLVDPLVAELPAFSVDWRFLLPVQRRARMLAAGDESQGFFPYFSGLDVVVISFLPRASPGLKPAAAQLVNAVIFDPSHPPFEPRSFDILAMPFGLPQGFLEEGDRPSPSLDRLLRPGGTLLVGALNRWSLWRRRSNARRDFDRPALQRLLGRAGFRVERVYGAVPDLHKPAYILPLDSQALGFFLRHRFSGRRARRLSPLFSLPFLSKLLSGLLPGYFLVAQQRKGSA
jgi:SAM-dependent methyltransferase